MRVLLLNYEFPPLGGGASTASFHLARSLAKRGHTVDVVTSRFGSSPAFEQIDGVSVWRVWSWRNDIQDCGLRGAGTYALSATFRILSLLRDHQYDVVHYFFGIPTGALCLSVPPLRRIPSVLSLRGSDVPGYDRSTELLPRLHYLLRGLSRRIWSSMDRIIANSGGLRELAETSYRDQEIRVIHNAVSTDMFRPPLVRTEALARPVRILCVARLIARKGVRDLIQAVAQIDAPAVHLVLQGSGRDEASLRDYVASLGMNERVEFGGFKPQRDLPRVYAEADLFVLPSYSESCSMALLEAMASGLPVVATNVGGTPELIQDGCGGLLVPESDPKALSAAIAHLAGRPECRNRMGAFNRSRVEKFSWDAVSQAYLDEYAAAIVEHAARTRSHSGAGA